MRGQAAALVVGCLLIFTGMFMMWGWPVTLMLLGTIIVGTVLLTA